MLCFEVSNTITTEKDKAIRDNYMDLVIFFLCYLE